MGPTFLNRSDAGEKLVKRLAKYKNRKDAIVLAIPRGGVVVGYEIAKALKVKLDIIVTKKIGYPENSELAIGAVSLGGKAILDEAIVSEHDISRGYINAEVKEMQREVERRYKQYRGGKKLPELKSKIVIIVDDGIATGYTTLAAIQFVKSEKPKKIILAVPVIPRETFESLQKEADEIVCLNVADVFFSISRFYEEFPQLEDEEVKKYL